MQTLMELFPSECYTKGVPKGLHWKKALIQKDIPGRVRMLLTGSHITSHKYISEGKKFLMSRICKIFEKSKNCKICKNCRETFRGSISLKGSHTSMVGHSPSARAAQGDRGISVEIYPENLF